MPSPFPGMDPYLEPFWGDVHQRLITYASDQLQTFLPGDLRARVEERVFVESRLGYERKIYPDIRVVERGRGGNVALLQKPKVALPEPFILQLPPDPVTESYLEIIDLSSGKKVVTAIEVLSPTNKTSGSGQDLYQQKQKEFLDGRVNLIEIDLLRAGNWVLSVPLGSIPESCRTTYRVLVRRGCRPGQAEIYPIALSQRLPTIKIPLRPKDADVPLDLQALIDQCYRNGGYDDDLDYGHLPHPPLTPDEAGWIGQLLQTHRSRRRPKARKKPAKGRRKKER